MSEKLRFDGKVALITGAGGGLGKEYALEFARRGASVVVNDLGGDMRGGGKGSSPADKVVDEIRRAGGKAVANYNSVEDGEKVVQTALDNFGRIDILVNNAGILRDRSFARISDEDWDIIQRVHLRGSFQVTRAAWPHMKKNKYGRVIMTSSAAGIYGNFGQANYSAAKLGLLGLSNTLSVEGSNSNIHCNTVAPMAGSRMTESVMPPDVHSALKPEYVAPVVVYLCHETCEENGGLFEIGGGWVGKLRWERTQGTVVRNQTRAGSAEDVRNSWSKVCDFTGSTNPAVVNDTSMQIVTAVQNEVAGNISPNKVSASSGDINLDLIKSTKSSPINFSYEMKDAILYALGIGVETTDPDYLKFLFEGASDFNVFPTFGVIPAFYGMMQVMSEGIPGLSIDPTKILHGEQYLELYEPLQPEAKLVSHIQIADVLDKGSGCVIIMNIETFNENKKKVAFNQFTTFVVGAGNFGGPRKSTLAKEPISHPARKPDYSIQQKTTVNQAAIYRLSGDRNPLHIDPSFAAMGGFETPILHGLCSFGYAARHILRKYANNDVSLFRAIKVRFSKPVIPGQTLQTDMWKEGNRIHFTCTVVENGNVCLSGAYIDLFKSAEETTAQASEVSTPEFKSDMVFEEMLRRADSEPDVARKVNAVIMYNITKDGSQMKEWTIDMKAGNRSIYPGKPKGKKAECTVVVSDDDMMSLAAGKLDPQKAFFAGKLKLKGNMMLAQRLSQLLKTQAKL